MQNCDFTLFNYCSFHQPHKKQYKLSINTTGHVLYVFLNNKLVGKHEHLHLLSKEVMILIKQLLIYSWINIGKQYAPNGGFEFKFERNVTVRHGKNNLALISATVGLKVGSFFKYHSISHHLVTFWFSSNNQIIHFQIFCRTMDRFMSKCQLALLGQSS